MIGRIRIGLALLFVALVTLVLAPFQYLAVRTRLLNPGLIPPRWHRMTLKVLGVRVNVHGHIASGRPLLIVSNHISWLDIVVLASLGDISFIAKSEMARWPVFGTLARFQRVVFVERERKRKSGEQASEIALRLAANDVMVLFAEGTTGDGNLMSPFKSTLFGAAEIAVTEGTAEKILIQPVSLAYVRFHGMPMGRVHRPVAAWVGDQELVPHLLQLLRQGGVDVEVRFGEPVEFNAESSRKLVTRQMETQVRTMMTASLRDARRKS